MTSFLHESSQQYPSPSCAWKSARQSSAAQRDSNTYALRRSNSWQLGWKTKLCNLVSRSISYTQSIYSTCVLGRKTKMYLPELVTHAVGDIQLRQVFHHPDCRRIHQIQRSTVIGFLKGISIGESVSFFVSPLSLPRLMLVQRLLTRCWSAHTQDVEL